MVGGGRMETCPTGRAVRLVDALAFATDDRILPDHVVREDCLAQL